MDTLDIFDNIENQSLDSFDFTVDKEEQVEETQYSKPANPVYFGKSFEYAGRWAPGQSYYNDNYRVTFVAYKNYLLACNLTHISSEETEPVILYENGSAVGVENIYWQLVLSGDSTENLINIQTYIEELQEKVNKNTSKIETNNASVEIVSKQYNSISQHLNNVDKRNEEIEMIFSKQTPWIGSKEEYESLEDKDPDKFYFIYEE